MTTKTTVELFWLMDLCVCWKSQTSIYLWGEDAIFTQFKFMDAIFTQFNDTIFT